MRVLALTVLLGASFVAVAQGPSQVVDGWQGAKWGMTPAEVLAAVPGSVSDPAALKGKSMGGGPLVLKAILPETEIRGLKFEVLFEFDNADKLGLVVVRTFGEGATDSAFSSFKDLLIERYGAVSSENRKREAYGLSLDATWVRPRGSVRLGLFDGAGVKAISIQYRDLSTSEAQKL